VGSKRVNVPEIFMFQNHPGGCLGTQTLDAALRRRSSVPVACRHLQQSQVRRLSAKFVLKWNMPNKVQEEEIATARRGLSWGAYRYLTFGTIDSLAEQGWLLSLAES
jgi:hypothetical protein